MAKKKNQSNVDLILLIISAVFGLLATAMIFLPAFVGEAEIGVSMFGVANEVSFTGVQASFGYTQISQFTQSIVRTEEILTTNFFSLMAYLIPVVSVIFLALFSKKKLVNYICAGALIAAGIFAFISLNTFNGAILHEYYKAFFIFTLGVGAILCGVFAILSGLVVIAKILAFKDK